MLDVTRSVDNWRVSSRHGLLALLVVAGLAVGAEPPAAQAQSAEDRASIYSLSLSKLETWARQEQVTLGAAILQVNTGKQLASSGAHALLNPASNSKLLTAATALSELGPGYRYTTGIYGEIDASGAAAELVLRGHGDPSLSTEQLARMADALVGMGLKRVDALLVDQSRFDASFVPPAFEQQPNEWASFRAPVSAVAVDENSVTLNVLPQKGGAARAWFHPPGLVEAKGSIRVTPRGKGQSIGLTLRPEAGRLLAKLSGGVAEGLPQQQFTRRIADPTLAAGYVLRELCARRGVQVAKLAAGGAKHKQRLVYVRSEPLAVLVQRLGKDSDNFYAEMILKTLAGEKRSGPASSTAGAEIVHDWARAHAAAEPGTRIVNGSGLFDANRVSASTLVQTLASAYTDPAISTEFVAELSIGGVDGTLRSRFAKYAASRTIRAKSGTLRDTIALSGYVFDKRGQNPVAFSVILNGLTPKQHAEARRRIDAVVIQIAGAP